MWLYSVTKRRKVAALPLPGALGALLQLLANHLGQCGLTETRGGHLGPVLVHVVVATLIDHR